MTIPANILLDKHKKTKIKKKKNYNNKNNIHSFTFMEYCMEQINNVLCVSLTQLK